MPTNVDTAPPARVAIVHDWLNGYRGGERVLEAICELYPQAEIFTLFYSPGKISPIVERHRIHASFLNRIPGWESFYRHLLPLFPLAIESFQLGEFDLVISSSHCVAKGVIPSPGATHVCYCHTPMRYAWDRSQDYFSSSVLRSLIAPFLHYLRLWDVSSSARVDHFIANSGWIAKRIEKYYRRPAEVIYPFVDLARLPLNPGKRQDYYLVVSAFAPYKRIDLAIRACESLGRRLVIVGGGPQESYLKKIAGKTVEFVGRLEPDALSRIYSDARALLFPGEEDFGITPLEAMASGTPVIAFARGGATESVIDGKTGVLFEEQSVASLVAAIEELERGTFSPHECRARAEAFNRARFKDSFNKAIARQFSAQRTIGLESAPGRFAPVETL